MTTSRPRPVLGPVILTALVTTLVARKDIRDRLLARVNEVAGTLGETAVSTYEDRVKPLAEETGARVQDLAQDALHTGAERLGNLTDTLKDGVQTGLGAAQVGLQAGLQTAQSGLHTAQQSARDAVAQATQTVQQSVDRQVAGGQKALEQGGKRAQKAVQQGRKDLTRSVKQGRREAERAVKRARKLGTGALDKAERQALKRAAQYGLVEQPPRTDPVAAGLLTVGIVGVSGYLLARSPSVRQGILDAVRAVSPQAADALHSAGVQVRNIIGSVWLERTDEADAAAAPAAPRGGQGASAYGSPEPGSDAAKRAQQESPVQVPPTEGETPKPDSTKH